MRFHSGMKFINLALAVIAQLFLMVSLGHAAGDASGKNAQYIKRGRALYVQYCVSCHGSSGKGDGPAASALNTAPSDLTGISKEFNGFPSDRIANYIDGEKAAKAHGSSEMPVWGKRFQGGRRGEAASFGDIFALTKYLESIQK